MPFSQPTQAQIDACIEIYHKYPTKEVTFEMLRECRDVTALGFMKIKMILEDYINKTYKNRR